MLVALILIHEFGHFIAAKIFGVRIEEFAIGFPPRIAKIRRNGTYYTFNLLLFGGFVRLLGENEQPGAEALPGQGRGSFAFRSGWVQAAITLAGVLMNFVLAWIIFITVFLIGIQGDVSTVNPQYVSDIQTTIVGIAPNSPASKAGLEPNDVLTAARAGSATLAEPISSNSFEQFTASHPSAYIVLSLERGGHSITATVQPQEGIVQGRAAIGVELADLGTERFPLLLAGIEGSRSMGEATALTAAGLGGFLTDLIRGHADFSNIAGPIGIAQIGTTSIGEGWSAALLFMAIISINLALLNMLPIPGLDGGRLLFIVIERLKGSPLSAPLVTRITIAGFALLITLMIVVTYHDMARLL